MQMVLNQIGTAIIQAQRDYFAVHTYKRIDLPGSFYINWEDEREELRAE